MPTHELPHTIEIYRDHLAAWGMHMNGVDGQLPFLTAEGHLKGAERMYKGTFTPDVAAYVVAWFRVVSEIGKRAEKALARFDPEKAREYGIDPQEAIEGILPDLMVGNDDVTAAWLTNEAFGLSKNFPDRKRIDRFQPLVDSTDRPQALGEFAWPLTISILAVRQQNLSLKPAEISEIVTSTDRNVRRSLQAQKRAIIETGVSFPEKRTWNREKFSGKGAVGDLQTMGLQMQGMIDEGMSASAITHILLKEFDISPEIVESEVYIHMLCSGKIKS